MMDRVLCSRAREVGGCRHVPRGAHRTDPQTITFCCMKRLIAYILSCYVAYYIILHCIKIYICIAGLSGYQSEIIFLPNL